MTSTVDLALFISKLINPTPAYTHPTNLTSSLPGRFWDCQLKMFELVLTLHMEYLSQQACDINCWPCESKIWSIVFLGLVIMWHYLGWWDAFLFIFHYNYQSFCLALTRMVLLCFIVSLCFRGFRSHALPFCSIILDHCQILRVVQRGRYYCSETQQKKEILFFCALAVYIYNNFDLCLSIYYCLIYKVWYHSCYLFIRNVVCELTSLSSPQGQKAQ